MAAHPPPVPPEQQSSKAPPAASPVDKAGVEPAQDGNPREQGRSGNIRQNTTHQGHQQDR